MFEVVAYGRRFGEQEEGGGVPAPERPGGIVVRGGTPSMIQSRQKRRRRSRESPQSDLVGDKYQPDGGPCWGNRQLPTGLPHTHHPRRFCVHVKAVLPSQSDGSQREHTVDLLATRSPVHFFALYFLPSVEDTLYFFPYMTDLHIGVRLFINFLQQSPCSSDLLKQVFQFRY